MSNRLQKKCVIAATSFHLLLMLILVVGPAFFSQDSKRETTQEIDYVPAILIDEASQGGGSPKGGQTAPPPQRNDPPPTPKLPDPPVKDPEPKQDQQAIEPVKSVVKPPPKQKQEEAEEAIDAAPKKQQKHTVKVDLTEVKNNATTKPKPQNSTRPANSESSADKELAKAVEALKGAAKGIRSSMSGSTSIEMRGPGGGGPTYAGYNSEIQRIYKQRYDLYLSSAGNVGEEQTSVEASITISRDGTVTSTRIVTPSRNAALNKLVERVLDSVNKLRPFPEGSKDAQRTLNIIFELTPKQGLG